MESGVGLIGEKRAVGTGSNRGVGCGRRDQDNEEGFGLGFVDPPPHKLVRAGDVPTTFYYSGQATATTTRPVQPLQTSVALSSPGLGMGGPAVATTAAWQRYPFTSTQWQELHRQAMIYKHFVASVPVPTELLLPSNLVGRSGGCLNVRFGNGVDPEPGRCRRTDGKKWRCSNDAAPGQKYCERHVHRGRPRSRKPVEQHNQKPNKQNSAVASRGTAKPTPPVNQSSKDTLTVGHAGPLLSSSTGFFPKPEFKLPFLPIETTKQSSVTRYADWIKTGEAATIVEHQYEDQFNLNYADFNNQCYPFLNSGIPSVQEDSIVNQRGNPRSFIDAWSTENLPSAASDDKHLAYSSGKLLSLSMAGADEEAELVEMGLGLSDGNVKSWIAPGPLGEVLQSSTVTSPHHNSCSSKSSCGGGVMNLMGKGGESYEVSPRASPTHLQASSPSGVLQKAMVSLSDSSCSSSPSFALQWMSNPK